MVSNGHCLFSLDKIHNASEVYTPNYVRPEGMVETTFPILRIEHCEKLVNLSDGEQR